MKKIIPFLLPLFLAALPLKAETDTRTAQFLRKLNLYYYCPSREGLKGFTCDLTLSVSDAFKKSLTDLGDDPNLIAALDGQKFTLSITSDGRYGLNLVEPASSGNPAFDANLEKQLADVESDFKSVLETWTDDVFKPGFDEDTLSRTVCTVSKRPKGFIVEQKAADGSVLKITYDAKAKQTEALGKTGAGKVLFDGFWKYSSGPHGYQLDAYQILMPVMKASEEDRFIYEQVGNFMLPKRIIKEIRFGDVFGKGSAVMVDFSNYRLVQ